MRRRAPTLSIGLALLVLTCALEAPTEAHDTAFRRFGQGEGMVQIPAGPFTMGANGRGRDEAPEHTVTLDAYSIDRFEVTQSEYQVCVDAGSCPPNRIYHQEGGPKQPVVGVTWKDAERYCHWAGKRLPTEAEWEKAARGVDGRLYPWGNTLQCGDANYGKAGKGQNNECPSAPGHTTDVGSYPRDVSVYGVYDMAGNVWEHVADLYDSGYYNRSPSRNPKGPSTGTHHVLKGGSWYATGVNIATSARIQRSMKPQQYDGFRCARDASVR